MRRIAILGVTAPALFLSACAGGGSGGTRAQPASVTPAVIVSPVLISAAAYVAAASSIDLYEMRSAQLALERARDPATKVLAERLLASHQGTSAQLSLAGRRLNLLPSAELDPDHQAMLDALNAASDFDSAYRAQQAIVLQDGLRLHSGFAKSGTSPTLRPVAQNAESVLRANLEALRRSR
jgi:putative membrane protein